MFYFWGSGNENCRLEGLQISKTRVQGICAFSSRNLLIEGCLVDNTGADGVSAGFYTLVRDSTFRKNADTGLEVKTGSRITHCISSENGENGFNLGNNSAIMYSSAVSNDSRGIAGSENCYIEHCNALYNGVDANDFGIFVYRHSSVRHCYANNNRGHGIYGNDRNTISDNTCNRNGMNATFQAAGIYFYDDDNVIERNVVQLNYWGIKAAGTSSDKNFIGSNRAFDNTGVPALGATADYDFDNGNVYGPIVTKAGGALSSTGNESHPHMNLRH